MMGPRPYSVDAADYLRVSIETTDAGGEPVLVAHEGSTRLGPGRAEKARQDIRATWAKDSTCIECQQAIHAPADAAWLMTADGARLAHRGTCFLTVLRRDYLASRPADSTATRAGAR